MFGSFLSHDFRPDNDLAFRRGDPMALKIESIHHVQVTVPRSTLADAIRFYGAVLGLERIKKPEPLRKNGGAWFKQGSFELHVSSEDEQPDPSRTKRHVCYVVTD